MDRNPFPKSVIAFAAHPDDTEIFMAGSLALLARRGWKVTICTLTAGGMGGIGQDEAATIRLRQTEAKAAADLLPASYFCLGGRDGYLYDTVQLRIAALSLIRRQGAGMVLTHLPNDYHADHRATAAIVDAAAMLATLPNCPVAEPPLERTPLFYHSAPLGLKDPLGNAMPPPHFLVDVGSVETAKMAMLACHRSQIDLMRIMHGMDDFFGAMQVQDRTWGQLADCEFAEAWWQHLGGGFPQDAMMQTELAAFLKMPAASGARHGS